MSIISMGIEELSLGLGEGRFSCREVTEAYFKRIKEVEPVISAYITLTPEVAFAAADEADARRARGAMLSPLDGIPVALKDVFCTRGVLTTCASKMLYNFVPPYDSNCWKKLQDAGAVLMGKTNMDEFAMGATTETSAYGLTRNPFAVEHTPGGSSGGSAAAVAADMAAYALGSDTGGGVRQPAHYCGVVGLKPTYGRVSRFGIVAYASSMDQAGILTKTVLDAATVLEITAGQDPADSTSAPVAVGVYREACKKPVKGLKIGLPSELLSQGIGAPTLAAIEKAAEILRGAGAIVEEVTLPHSKYALPAYYLLSLAEASSNLARYDGVNFGLRVERDNVYDMMTATRTEGFGEEVKARLLLGTYALSAGQIEAYYNRTLQVRTLVKNDFEALFAAGYDCLLGPVASHPAHKFGAMDEDPLAMYMTDACTVSANLAGLPGMSVPFAQHEGLPLGLQLIGRPFGEETLFSVGAALEQPRLIPPDILAQADEKGVAYHD